MENSSNPTPLSVDLDRVTAERHKKTRHNNNENSEINSGLQRCPIITIPDLCIEKIATHVLTSAGDAASLVKMTMICTAFSSRVKVAAKDICTRSHGFQEQLSEDDVSAMLKDKLTVARLLLNSTTIHCSEELMLNFFESGFNVRHFECWTPFMVDLHRGSVQQLGSKSWMRTLQWSSFIPTIAVLPHDETNKALRVINGSDLKLTVVGGIPQCQTIAQIPPADGDSWAHSFWLQKGTFDLAVRGGCNPFHGHLKISLDGKEIGDQDWSSTATRFPVEKVIKNIQIPHSGVHELVGVVAIATTVQQNANCSWMCLTELTLTPSVLYAPVVEPPQLPPVASALEALESQEN
jgi:hypothetical protein